MVARIRDGLLRDNKVVPAVLGVLALLIFAWLVAGTLLGGSGDEEQQASNQASLAPGDDSDGGSSETPAPEVENRDSDASYGGYDEGPKDPFRQIVPKAGKESTNGGQGGNRGVDQSRDEKDRDGGDRAGGSTNGDRGDNGRVGSTGRNSDDEDFIEQRTPGTPGSRSSSGGADQDGTRRGGVGQAETGQGDSSQAGAGPAGGGGLFNSGGDLPTP